MPYPFVISIEKILHSAMNVDKRERLCLPLPPTPSSSMLPFGWRSTRVMPARSISVKAVRTASSHGHESRRVKAPTWDAAGARATWLIASMNMTSLCVSRVNLGFNSGSLAVVVSCYSLNTVEGIRETSCPSLGRNQGRGAEIAT